MALDPNKEVQQFGPYQLVIREKAPSVQAALWKGGVQLCKAEAASREQAAEDILLQMGLVMVERARARGTVAPGTDEMRSAFQQLWSELNDGQRAMLSALHRAPGQELRIADLAAAAGYKGTGGVNLWLGFAGLLFGEFSARGDLQLNKKGQPVPTSWFCIWDVERHTWTMRPEVSAGMLAADCLA